MPEPATFHDLDAYTDVTGSLADAGPEDTIFTSPTGKTIKVKARRREVGFGLLAIDLSGSLCDAEGHALADGEGHKIGPVHPFTAQADNPGAVAGDLDRTRRRVADEIERIATVAETNLPGVA